MKEELQKFRLRRQKRINPGKLPRKAKATIEKTTLGDISDLAALKEEMEEKQNKSLKK